MLPKQNRLSKKADIKKVLKKGKTLKEDFLVVKLAQNNLKNSRFAFIVSKKISKKATIRNKTKRRLREILRLKVKQIKPGFDIILLALPGLEKKDFREIEGSLNRIFIRAKIF